MFGRRTFKLVKSEAKSGAAKNLLDSLPVATSQPSRNFFMHQWRSFQRWQELEQHNKEWFEYQRRRRRMNDKSGYLSPEMSEYSMVQKPIADQGRWNQGVLPLEIHLFLKQFRVIDHSFDNIRRVQEYKRFHVLQYDQRFLPERLLFLGPDLAAAHFIVHRGGTVKFVGDSRWFKRNRKLGSYSLPGRKMDGLYLEAIDASGTELMFEGFDNLYDLEFMRMLSLRECHWIDDWVLSRIGAIFSDSLELLDLSHCRRISAKGFYGLRSLSKLRFLRLEGLDGVEGIAKSALMLEEAIPNLTITGLDYGQALSKLEEEEKLLKHDRVVQDAKGNAFVEDDNGRLFYVKGSVNERPAVCDEDKPMMTSLIRRELPRMDPEEFEQLDDLTKGKLRHFLVGSPSGYSWTEQVETILTHEDGWRAWERIPTDIKMSPRYKRTALLEARRRKALSGGGEVWPLLQEEGKKEDLALTKEQDLALADAAQKEEGREQTLRDGQPLN